jgi:hypothetical protein
MTFGMTTEGQTKIKSIISKMIFTRMTFMSMFLLMLLLNKIENIIKMQKNRCNKMYGLTEHALPP